MVCGTGAGAGDVVRPDLLNARPVELGGFAGVPVFFLPGVLAGVVVTGAGAGDSALLRFGALGPVGSCEDAGVGC